MDRKPAPVGFDRKFDGQCIPRFELEVKRRIGRDKTLKNGRVRKVPGNWGSVSRRHLFVGDSLGIAHVRPVPEKLGPYPH